MRLASTRTLRREIDEAVLAGRSIGQIETEVIAPCALDDEARAALWLYADARLAHSLVHIAFTAGNHAAVDAFYREGLKARGRDNGAPGARKDYSPTYYAAFLLDPDGNNVEAVCLK